MRKIFILTSVLFIGVILTAVLYFSQLSGGARNNYKILNRIPSETALIFQFKNDNLINDIFKNYELFNVVLGEQRVAEITQIRSLFLKQVQLLETEGNQDIFLSVFPNKADSVDILWTLSLGDNLSTEDIYEILQQPTDDFESKKIAIYKEDVLAVTIKNLDKTFYIFLKDGIAAGSFSKLLIEKFLDPSVKKISKELIADISSLDQKNNNSPFNIFINHASAFSFSKNFLRNQPDGNFLMLNQLKGFSVLNMNFKSDALMFNGIAKIDTSSASYINLFLSQNPVNNTLKKAFPINTASFITFGISDYKKFNSGLRNLFKKRNELQKLDNQITHLSEKYNINVERDIAELWADEFAVIQLSSNEKLAIIKLSDARQMDFLLRQMSTGSSGEIRRLNDSYIPYYFFGDPLKNYLRPYFTIVDNYLVISNDGETIQRFNENYTSENLLYKTPEYTDFNQFTSNQSNITYFIHNKNSALLLKNTLKSNYADLFTGTNATYKDFYGLAFQWSGDKDHFFINLYTNYTASDTKKLDQAWKYPLNGRLAITPQIIFGNNDEKIILVQDNVNNLYFLTAGGKKLWSTQLPDRIIGDVHQLKDKTLLFNTRQQLYRISLSGSNFKGFPLKLAQDASFGLTITETDPDKLKIFVPCNSKISAFDATGSALAGWNGQLNGKILFDLKTGSLNNINYLVAGTESGSFYFFNYAGNLITKAENNNQFRNPLSLEINTDITNSRVVSTDTAGIVRSIFLNGNISGKSTGTWSSSHFFDYYNVSGDIRPELIYTDKNQLFVYGTDSILIYSYDFGITSVNRPQFFPVNQSMYRIGISSAQGNLLYLFDEDGNLERGFPVTGVPFFQTGSLDKNGIQYLICEDTNNYLYVYKL